MSSRVFQSVVLQMKDSTDRAIGVIDSEGTVVACNELSCIGEHWPGVVEAVNRGDGGAVRFEGRTFKALAGWGAQFDYAAFVKGEDAEAQTLCAMAVVALNGAKTYYEEKHDKATFVKNIISDNILLGDIYVRAKELHFVSEAPRAVLLIRQVETTDPALIDVVQTMFPDKQVDFVLSISETDVALIQQLPQLGHVLPFQAAPGQGRHKVAGGAAVQPGEHRLAVVGQVVLPAYQGGVAVAPPRPLHGHKALVRQAGEIGVDGVAGPAAGGQGGLQRRSGRIRPGGPQGLHDLQLGVRQSSHGDSSLQM